ncbi:MAG: antitoxin VbhA family protein [Azonexus sp.]|jgi:hypothetical protein|nr:antitoxin VbhA family protein [Azonexus sp.]
MQLNELKDIDESAHPAPAPVLPFISDAERQRREKASKRAEASSRLEGLTISAAAKAISAEWERGEMTGAEMTERVKALYVRRG